MNNMDIYERVRSVPDTAQKKIQAGRLKGKTDINPMWRIKILTEIFGMCGFGWKYEIVSQRLERTDSGESAAFVDILLYVKQNDIWSEPIPGTGGSSFVAKERNGLYVSDECFKMALTDAISVACKALGVGADIYWDADSTKYNSPCVQNDTSVQPILCSCCGRPVQPGISNTGKQYTALQVFKAFGGKCLECYNKSKQEGGAAK